MDIKIISPLCVALITSAIVLVDQRAAVAAPPCELDSIVSTNTLSGSTIISGQNVDFTGHVSWSFVDQGSSIRITEKIAVDLPGIQAGIAQTMAQSTSLPNDDCNVTSSITGQSVLPKNPDLVAHIDFSATKWTCPGLDVPCPTFSKPFRTCYKRLAKTILGQGSGWFEARLHPSFVGHDIQISTSPSSDFHLSSGTALVLGMFAGPVLANLLPTLAKAQLSGSAANIDYPTLTIPASELQGGEASTPVQLEWTDANVYFEDRQGSAALSRERYVDEPPRTACFLRKVFSTM